MKLFLLLVGFCFSFSFYSLVERDTTLVRIEKIPNLKEKIEQYNHASQAAWEMGRYDEALGYTGIGLTICEENNFINEKVKLI